jgi:HipA N-terminal domain
LATQGRTPESFNAVERLCYTGARGMGALEFAAEARLADDWCAKIQKTHRLTFPKKMSLNESIVEAPALE